MTKEILSLLMCLIIVYFIKDIVTVLIVLCIVSIMLQYIFEIPNTTSN
jgi:hypothetical protein